MGKSAGRVLGDVMTGGLAEPLYFGPQDAARQQANAAQGAAMAQQQFAQQNYGNISNMLSNASVSSLATMDSAIGQQQQNIDSQLELVKQIDPTIMEASKNALNLLRGQQSQFLAPIQAQRNQQRQQLLNTLRQQMGSGAETSTAGMQALNNFDMQTNSLLSQQQQGALSLMNQTGATYAGMRPNIGGAIGELGALGQGRFGIVSNHAGLLNQAANPMMQTAGAQFTGDALMGKFNQAQNAQLAQLGMTGAGFALGGAAGGMGAKSFGSKMMAGADDSSAGGLA